MTTNELLIEFIEFSNRLEPARNAITKSRANIFLKNHRPEFKNLDIPHVTNCTLEDLNIGDKVLIKHAHELKNGCWGLWSGTNYQYLGREGVKYRFQNTKYEHEHFTMTKDNEPSHKFVGRYCL